MSALPRSAEHTTEAEYLASERASEFKHEFIDGIVYAMSGGSLNHNLITSSTIATLHRQLSGQGCRTLTSDMKVRLPATGSYAYPDVSVVCGTPQLNDDEGDVLLNPTLIVEVLSPSTEAHDRGRKFQLYRGLESLQEYVLIAQDSPRIERFVRQNDGTWQFNDAQGLDAALDLSSVAVTLTLAEVYEQVDFSAESESSATD